MTEDATTSGRYDFSDLTGFQDDISEDESVPMMTLSEMLKSAPPADDQIQVTDWYQERDNAEAFAEMLREIVDWVDWLIESYNLTTSTVPPCWFLHTDVVYELYALWLFQRLTYNASNSGDGPVAFHERFHLATQRLALSSWTCTKEEHHPPHRPSHPTRRAEAWQQLVYKDEE